MAKITQSIVQYWRKVSRHASGRKKSSEATMEEGTSWDPEPKRRLKPPTKFKPRDLEGVARFLNASSDFWVFRRFGKLHLFNLLRLELELTKLEFELDQHILSEENKDDPEELFTKIHLALSAYDEALSAQAKFKSYQEPGISIIEQLRDWATGAKSIENGQPLLQGLDIPCPGTPCTTELASIAAVEKSWTHRFIDKHDHLRKVFELPVEKMPPEQRPSSKIRTVLLYSEDNVRRTEAVFLHLSFCIVLLGPVIGLSYLESKVWRLVLLTTSLFVVSVLCVALLNAPNKGSLALVAGYAAILVVFLSGNVGT